MTRSQIFKMAHANARAFIKMYPGVDYKAQLGLALKCLFQEAKIKKIEKEFYNFHNVASTRVEVAKDMKEVNQLLNKIEAFRLEVKATKLDLTNRDFTKILNLMNGLELNLSDRVEEIQDNVKRYFETNTLHKIFNDIESAEYTNVNERYKNDMFHICKLLDIEFKSVEGNWYLNNKNIYNAYDGLKKIYLNYVA